MSSLLLVILSNFRRKKMQTLLIGVIILASSLIFATAAGIMGSMHRPFENMFERQNAPHMLLMFDERMHDPEEISRWWEGREEVTGMTGIIRTAEANRFTVNGKEFSTSVMLSELPEGDIEIDRLQAVEGDESYPGETDIWIPTAFAYSNNISIGDTMIIETEAGKTELTVKAIVVDPYFSSGFVYPVRLWTSIDSLPLMFDIEGLTGVTIGIRLDDPAAIDGLWREFENHLGMPFSGFRIDHEIIRFSYFMIMNIISVILLVFSLVIVAVALYIIFSTITTSVVADYRNIGILKSQGVTSLGVVLIYVIQYGLLSAAAIILGLAGSVFAIRALLNSTARSMGIMAFDIGTLIPYLVFTLILLTALVLLAAFLSARGAGRIKPALAIRFGAPPRDHSRRGGNISLNRLTGLSVSALLGLKQIFTDRKQAVSTLIFVAVTTFVLVFAVNTYVSVVRMGDYLPMWGFDESDLYLTMEDSPHRPGHETLMTDLLSDNRVKNVVSIGFIGAGVIPETEEYPSRNIMGEAYGGDLSAINMINLEGRHPASDTEISVGVNTARRYGLSIGDPFEMYIMGELFVFEITGIYQHINNMGESYRIQMDAVKKAIPDYEPMQYALMLHDTKPEAVDSFMSDYENRYGDGVSVSKLEDYMGSSFEMITLNVAIAMGLLALVFTTVLMVILINTTLLNIHREKKLYGIMKASGMTPVELRMSLLWRTIALGLPGIFMGVAAGLWGGPYILSILMLQMGIANYPAVIEPVGIVLAVAAAFGIALLSTWMPSGRVMDISSRNLIVE